jgi:RimJ/RimL family protein N-acetyltransferase
MKIPVNDQIYLSEHEAADKQRFVEYLNEREIYDNTLRIPFPYTEADAEAWLNLVASMTKQHGQPIHWAIRNVEGGLLGGCGFQNFEIGKSHQAEIGYWLAKPFWGKGIMPAVVRRVCRHAFDELGLMKITAHVFSENTRSARVLEKCGFREEGHLRKHFRKDDRYVDARMFGLLADE